MATDIQTKHFIYRYTPERFHPYFKLARLDRPIGTWLLLFPCWWAVTLSYTTIYNMPKIGWLHMFLYAIGALLMRSAGCVINDLWDIKLDAQVERTKTRPLASGDLSRQQAFAFLALLLALSLGILLAFKSTLGLILGVLSLALVVSYPLMKRITWWPQAFLGLTFNWGALMGFATDGKIEIAAFLLYAGGILWTLGYDTIYAHQDTNDDALVGIKSTALLFGDNSKKYVCGFYAGAISLFTAAKFAAAPSIMTPLLLMLPIGYVIWMLRRWNPTDPKSSLTAFRDNCLLGWVMLLVFSL